MKQERCGASRFEHNEIILPSPDLGEYPALGIHGGPVDLAYGLFEFSVKEAPVSDLTPNSPTHRGSVSMGYQGRQGFDGMVTFRFSSGHQWTAGVFDGWVPARQTFDLSLGYAINNNVRVFALGTNILDQERFQMFGGSVIGRRIMAGATANF